MHKALNLRVIAITSRKLGNKRKSISYKLLQCFTFFNTMYYELLATKSFLARGRPDKTFCAIAHPILDFDFLLHVVPINLLCKRTDFKIKKQTIWRIKQQNQYIKGFPSQN